MLIDLIFPPSARDPLNIRLTEGEHERDGAAVWKDYRAVGYDSDSVM